MSKNYPNNACIVCHTSFPHRHAKKAVNLYCSKKCEGENKRRNTFERFQAGEVRERNTIRKILKDIKHECWSCGLMDWRGHRLSLEIDHINGDAGNNMPSNLRLVCPNCHSITSTWKGRNRHKGRASRGLPTN